MPLPTPEPGLVISYAYLWRREHDRGAEEARKTRPCVIILVVETDNDSVRVTVAPITHRAPDEDDAGLLLPPRVKQHLGLDDQPSWVVVSEVNQFTWPGFDLRPILPYPDKFDYGFVPPRLFERIKAAMLDRAVQRRVGATRRD